MDSVGIETPQLAKEAAKLVSSGNWNRLIELTRDKFPDRGEEGLFLSVAELLSDTDQLDAADTCLQKARDRWPDNLWAHIHHAELYARRGDVDVAVALWRELIERHPESPLGICGLASLYRNLNREDDAASLFSAAAERYPNYVWAVHGHATTATWRHDWAEAARRWATVLNRFPNHLSAHIELLRALIEDERLVEAEEIVRRGLAAFPDDRDLVKLSIRLNEMAQDRSIENYIGSVFQHLLQRGPEKMEIALWAKLIGEGLPEREFFRRILRSPEYGKQPRVVPGHIVGTYYSPIVDPTEAAEHWRRSAASKLTDLVGIQFDLEDMKHFWQRNREFMGSMNFSERSDSKNRYFLDNGLYPNGDAVVLAGMIYQHRPRRIIEVGSGFSSAVMLDVIDRLGADTILTCIEPEADRLRSLLRPSDSERLLLIESKVQDVAVHEFAAMEANDILFIDSSHVMKAGSDLHFEMFSILPALKPGVIIHFHDCQFPFEYPESWVLKFRWAWNEIYVLRAFLMYNTVFRVIFFNDLFFKEFPEIVEGVIPGDRWPMKPLIGQSLWLRKAF